MKSTITRLKAVPSVHPSAPWHLDTVFPRRFECVKFFRSHHIACCLTDQYIERNFIHG